jgi:hypothetical protein
VQANVKVAELLGNRFVEPLNHAQEFGQRKDFLDRCLLASENLRTIDPHDKEENQALLARVQKWIGDASVAYILGYGFDESNSRRIGLGQLSTTSKTNAAIMFTNYDDINTVNKKASKLFRNTYDDFLHSRAIQGHPDQAYFEKSTRNVYEALEKDFDPLEERLRHDTKL